MSSVARFEDLLLPVAYNARPASATPIVRGPVALLGHPGERGPVGYNIQHLIATIFSSSGVNASSCASLPKGEGGNVIRPNRTLSGPGMWSAAQLLVVDPRGAGRRAAGHVAAAPEAERAPSLVGTRGHVLRCIVSSPSAEGPWKALNSRILPYLSGRFVNMRLGACIDGITSGVMTAPNSPARPPATESPPDPPAHGRIWIAR